METKMNRKSTGSVACKATSQVHPRLFRQFHGEGRYSLAPDDPGPPAGKQEEGRPVKWEKEEREDRPNAVTRITLRLQTEMRLCQVAIIGYTRWPFLNRPSAPVRRSYPRRAIIRPARIIRILCTQSYTLSVLYIRSLPPWARAVRNFREMEVGR